MQADESLNCKICFKLAREAVECANQKCHKLFCKACQECISRNMKKEEKETRCPFCRITPFNTKKSELKSKINSILIPCKHCHQNVSFVEVDQHERTCKKKKIKCKFCPNVFTRQQIVPHTKKFHYEMIPEIVERYQKCLYPIIDPEQVLEKELGAPRQGFPRPLIGLTGKFYCQNPLGKYMCKCCNDKCGPTNGQNCINCMQLDMIRRGLTKGYLVNANGEVCWQDQRHHFTCATVYDEQQHVCGKGSYCQWCRHITRTIKRYQELL